MADRKKTFASQLDAEQFNPAMQFISAGAPAPAQPEPQPRGSRTAPRETPREAPPAGYRMNPLYIENKTRRVQLLLKPSIYEAVKARAEAEGVSVNELINVILETATQGR